MLPKPTITKALQPTLPTSEDPESAKPVVFTFPVFPKSMNRYWEQGANLDEILQAISLHIINKPYVENP